VPCILRALSADNGDGCSVVPGTESQPRGYRTGNPLISVLWHLCSIDRQTE
jgi:hypothetical protein